ncbi:RNA-directed DNA polymerase, eukaryota, partial [Tanacetum coccineum]
MAGRVCGNADLTRSISKSIFVTNFPDNTSSKDPWNQCQGYGTIVDVYIPNRLSKAGKRFAFVVRFERSYSRPSQSTHPYKPVNTGAPTFASALKGTANLPPYISPSPALVLDDSCVVSRELDNYVMGEVKQFSSINNLCVLLSNEGFPNVKLAYLGGLWVMIELESFKSKAKFMKHVGVASWFVRLCNAQSDFVSRERIVWVDIEGVPLHVWSRATFHKIGSKWGEVMELEECLDDCFGRKRICIKTKQEDNILERFKIIVHGKIFVVRAKELSVWTPIFNKVKDVVYCTDDESVKGERRKMVEVVHTSNDKETSPDPFNIYNLLKKRDDGVDVDDCDSSDTDSLRRKMKSGGSILEVLDDMINVGHIMGYTMEGCIKDMEKIIGHLSDHRPILLRDAISNYGATPFRFYHSWLQLDGFDQMDMSTWTSITLDDRNRMIRFKTKLQILKKEIRTWVADYKRSQSRRLTEIKSKLHDIDVLLDQGGVNDVILLARKDLMKQLHDFKSSKARDCTQKAKIQWAIEEDENTKFFHGVINRKRANLSIKGIMVDGEWVDDPIRVKEEFRTHFATRFQAPATNRCRLDFRFPNCLSLEQASDLESPVTSDEIRNAVCGCGEDKSPGPDGFTFDFFRKFWSIIGPDFYLAVE